jgi:hypothetical protein
MKRVLAVSFVISFAISNLSAQDEGKIVKRERIERDKGIFVGAGISSASALEDYSLGINFEAGYSKRINRIISIGGSFSYLAFKYDPKITTSSKIVPTDIKTFPSNFYYDPTSLQDPLFINEGALISVSGANISMISLAMNLKVNFVPIKENTTISVYGFAKPFIASAASSSGSVLLEGVFVNTQYDLVKVGGASQSVPFNSESVITGGVFIGPGIEFFPNNPISFFLQATFGYTFPLDQSSIKSLPRDITKWTDVPVKSIGFSSLNFAGGISFNLD